MVLHLIKYQCHCPRQGLTRNQIRCQCLRHDMVSHENTNRILCHDICILTIPMVRKWLF
ncbi:hypothetical protein F383_15774 [Gossypium arboreum]|uniref:Uncharacterized protein n=1 Tax=Gossypium arboreum TaxID=29729 RepID=A0A0B0MLX4_GOSAR|nr:hypothetical protein F383_26545 [Gossypium arboreum]KHG10523.1 hypothetical protein F383_15774 [Gossypium arboreum]